MKLLNIKINYLLSSPWIRPDITFWTIFSRSIRTVFCITATISSNSLLLSKIFFFYTTAQCIDYDRSHVYLVTWTSLSCFKRKFSVFRQLFCFLCSFLFDPMFFCCGHAMLQIQIFLSVFSSKIKSGLLCCSPILSLYTIVVLTI